MFGIALLTSALLALAESRIYERCELARDLLSFGVKREHLATWVCIAFHESRFDTAARNPYSGDHGVLQISELYWCGAGKACGLPCSALRDEDISDDVECALQIYEEHTRLQGNGFLAWVVYPQHCKHNAKKYLADCDSSVKTSSVRTDGRARILKPQNRNITSFSYNPKIDELLPPYLTIGSLFRGNYEKQFEQNYNNKVKFDWVNYKIDNIDELKLPVFNQNVVEEYTTTTSATTTTTDSTLLKIKPPSPRRIESNSFRRKKTRPIFESVKFIETTHLPTTSRATTIAPGNIYKSTLENVVEDKNLLQSATTTSPWTAKTTTLRPSTKHVEVISSFTPFTSASIEQQTTKSPILYTSKPVQSTVAQDITIKTVNKPLSIVLPVNSTKSLVSPSLLGDKTKLSLSESIKTSVSANNYRYNSVQPTSSTSATPTQARKEPFNFKWQSSPSTTTTLRPWANSWFTWRTTSNYNAVITTTTSKPSPTTWRTTKTLSSAVTQRNDRISIPSLQNQSPKSLTWTKSPRVWPDFQTTSTKLPVLNNTTRSIKTHSFESTTSKPRTTINLSTITSPKTERSTMRTTNLPSPTTARSTQSIFDLYLNPTKRPKIDFSFPPFKNRGLSLKIFAGGTTTHSPIVYRSEVPKLASSQIGNSQIRRQTT